jgi:hypothetical protein
VARDIREHVVKDVTQCHRCLYLLDEDMDHEVKDCELNRRSMSERDLNDICKLLKTISKYGKYLADIVKSIYTNYAI